ncbi:MAG TPA: transglycosylase family protein [Conexibacter sp.]|nr:transglycosylase family protein [Conexibacter sp.]
MSTRLAVVPALLALLLAGALAAPASARAGSLKEGSRGSLVAQVQRKLHVPADGVFGPRTTHAVRRFQRRAHLTVDGVVGPRTARALGVDLAEGHSARGGDAVHVPAVLRRIARCESGGNPRAVSSDGVYRGKYQFDRETWHAIGGHGDPARASEAEQDRRALALYRERGTSPWPACGAAA